MEETFFISNLVNFNNNIIKDKLQSLEISLVRNKTYENSKKIQYFRSGLRAFFLDFLFRRKNGQRFVIGI